jgi:hypothetical protein
MSGGLYCLYDWKHPRDCPVVDPFKIEHRADGRGTLKLDQIKPGDCVTITSLKR